MIVTRLAWIAQRLVSSKRPMRWASAASCRARIADACQLYVWRARPCWISLTNRANGRRRIRRSLPFWYCLISRNARSPNKKKVDFAKRKIKFHGTKNVRCMKYWRPNLIQESANFADTNSLLTRSHPSLLSSCWGFVRSTTYDTCRPGTPDHRRFSTRTTGSGRTSDWSSGTALLEPSHILLSIPEWDRYYPLSFVVDDSIKMRKRL